MSALHQALMPPSAPRAVPAVIVDQKKVAQSVTDLTKIALELHLKQLEAKQRALHPQQSQSQQQPFVQQQHLAIHAPGQHMPRAVAAIANGLQTLPPKVFFFFHRWHHHPFFVCNSYFAAAASVPMPRDQAAVSPSDSADAILHRAMANVVKEEMNRQPHASHSATQTEEHTISTVSPSPSSAAAAILRAALSQAERTSSKTDLATPFAPIKVLRPQHTPHKFKCFS
jgi:hypothetical protein